jgi:hypothetical protein
MRWHFPIRAFAAGLLAAAHLCAQQPSIPNAPETPTLHVYVNLMQIPVLLLDSSHRPLPVVPQSRFQVEIEGMAPFAPARVRLENDDPISLAILLDNSDPDEYLWERLGEASREFATTLRPHDRVEVYGMDGCKLRRFLPESRFDAALLHNALDAAAAIKPYETMRKRVGPCASPIPFWDAALYVASALDQRTGRRILLALANGHQGGTPGTLSRLHKLMNADSITMFAIQHGEADSGSYLLPAGGRSMRSALQAFGGNNDLVNALTLQSQSELSGGMVLAASLHNLPKTLAKVIDLARGRYILEFPRPDKLAAGQHVITVSIGKMHDFIRPAGISVPTPTAAELASDPTVEHGTAVASPAEAPVADPPQPAAPQAVPTPAPTQSATPVSAPKPERSLLDVTDEAHPVAPPQQ